MDRSLLVGHSGKILVFITDIFRCVYIRDIGLFPHRMERVGDKSLNVRRFAAARL